jgi:cbb3-type cytochrome oxidase subunit 1
MNAWLYVHLAGVFGFLVAHGVSAGVGLKLRKERDPVRARALLDLSASTLNLANLSFLVLLVGGIGATSSEHMWSEGWPWAAIVVLIALVALVPTLVVPYYKKVRKAVGAPGARERMPAGEPASPEEIERVLGSPIPIVISVTGVVALAILLWLMVYKPF